ncbi:MAG: amidohydrolase [Acidobacteriota bacterium]|nr:amidohydrolase [Acidobacteriota bacterium]
MDESNPEVEALAIVDDRVVAVGDKTIGIYIGDSTRVIDLEGRLAVPGFIEGHGHLLKLGRKLSTLRLENAETWDEIVEMVAEAARTTPEGDWIFGRGWHQEKWTEPPSPSVRGLPVNDGLNAVSPNHPVHLRHASGHMGMSNARALEHAGITNDSNPPHGGEFIRREDGTLTGALVENAEDVVLGAFYEDIEAAGPVAARARYEREIDLATRECLSKGVTSFHDASASLAIIDLYRALADEGRLGLRLYVMVDSETVVLDDRLRDYRVIGYGGNRLTVRAIKEYIDGALGAHGAWLLEPYEDRPESTGHNTRTLETIETSARAAVEHDYQLCVHAIGDRGNREILDLYERHYATRPGEDLRWRVEHAQHLSPDDIPRFAGLGVIASMQGVHCISDGPWVPDRIGEKRAREGAYVWRALIDSGAVVANGTDTPVEDIDPIANFHALVTREMNDGTAFFPEQRMTHAEALRSMTLDAAYAAFEEETKGSLSPGKLADIVVLSRDIMTVPDDEILDTHVDLTILGGEVVYRGE